MTFYRVRARGKQGNEGRGVSPCAP